MYFLHFLPQATVTREKKKIKLQKKKHHNPYILPQTIPIIKTIITLTLINHLIIQQTQYKLFPNEMPAEEQPNPMGVTAVREGGPLKVDNKEATAAGPVSQRVDEE